MSFLSYSALYDKVLALRHLAYDKGWKKSCKSKIPVISIGSITMGGAGKTPLTLYLVKKIMAQGFTPVLLSRGYGRKQKGLQILPEKGETSELAARYGDEALLFRRYFPDLRLVLSEDRCTGVKYIEENSNADVILLDDGFQHRKLEHTADILIFKNNFAGLDEKYFPFGNLRDRLKRLEAADLILYENGMHPDVVDYLNQQSHTLPYEIEFTGPDPEKLTGKIAAFSGIADGKRFINTLQAMGIVPNIVFDFRDHSPYDQRQLNKLSAAKVDHYICTEKDYVKLPEEFIATHNVHIIKMKLIIDDNDIILSEIINQNIPYGVRTDSVGNIF